MKVAKDCLRKWESLDVDGLDAKQWQQYQLALNKIFTQEERKILDLICSQEVEENLQGFN